MSKEISIIVPIYNGEKYLERCIDSIINQSFGIEKIELLLLNDGSSDGSLKIAEKYAKKFPDSVKVYSHKNMGAAKTRNKGISLIKTKYTMFVDQDDFIDGDYCEVFFKEAEKNGADVVAGGFRRTDSVKVFYTRKATDTIWYPYIHAESWAKIHRTDFIKDSKSEFFDNIFGEDIPFTFNETQSTKKFKTIDYVGYNWFSNEESVTNTTHKDFSNLNLPKLLRRLGSMSNSEISEYYIIVVALYAFMVSSGGISRKDFQKNLDEIFSEFKVIIPSFSKNKYLKKRIEGCPCKTYMATRIFDRFYRNGWYGVLYLITSVFHKVTGK